jgi:Flp pilus assembly pilin Flp
LVLLRSAKGRFDGTVLRQRGQSLVEYGLILALVVVVAIAGLLLFRPAISEVLSNLSSSV